MQFVLIARDHTPDGLQRRLAVREQHILLGDRLRAEGHYHMGVALLNAEQQMIGSVMILDFPDRAALDDYLTREPYMTNNVWETMEILPCTVGPTFLK